MMVRSTLAMKTFFFVLIIVQSVAVVYGFVMDYYLSCIDPRARWLQVGVIHYCIYNSLIAAWFFYKESRWILTIVFMFLLFWLGSITICGYITIQFFKLLPGESLEDPIYHVLVRRQKGDVMEHAGRPSVLTTRVIFIALGCLMLGISVFVFIIDGSPFRAQVLLPCMVTLISDLCIQAVVFSVWVAAYKESSWINAFFWIIFILCFGSIAICVYIARELFYLSPEQHVSLILFNKTKRDLMFDDPLLVEQSDA